MKQPIADSPITIGRSFLTASSTMQTALLALRSIHRAAVPEPAQASQKSSVLASESKTSTRGAHGGISHGTKKVKQKTTVSSETKVSTLGPASSAKIRRQRTLTYVPERKVGNQCLATTLHSNTKKAIPKTAGAVSGSISETKTSSQSFLTCRSPNSNPTTKQPSDVTATSASDENMLVHSIATGSSLDAKNMRSRLLAVYGMHSLEMKVPTHNVGTNFTSYSRTSRPSSPPATCVSETNVPSPAAAPTVTRAVKYAPAKQMPTSATCVLEKTASSLSTSTATLFTSETRDWSQDVAAHSAATCSERKEPGASRRPAQRRAAKTYTCPVCQKAFPWLSSLKSHMRTHKGERLYKCEECAYATTKCSDYFAHLRLHSWRQAESEGASPAQRSRDGLGQPRAQSLDRPFKCRMGVFAPAQSRSVHAFASDSQQQQQQQPATVFKCAECKAEFASRTCYMRHVNTVHGNPLQ